MEYAIYPMKTISISQIYSESHCAWDIVGEDTKIENWYAPCRVKVLNILPYNRPGTFANTVLFGSCDKNGNEAAVMCQDGIARVLTFACTHMNDINQFGLQIGKIYESGEACYQEGNTGISYGNHVHMEVAEGWQTTKSESEKQWLLPNLTNIANVFSMLKGWNVIGGEFGANGYTFKEVSSRSDGNQDSGSTGDSLTEILNNGLNGVYLVAKNTPFRVRSNPVNGTELAMVPTGGEASIISFRNGFESDGYQWAQVYYKGQLGYSQLDLKDDYLIRLTDDATKIALKPIKEGFRVRASVVNGTQKDFVPVGDKARINSVNARFESDGYQWAFVSHGTVSGWSQMDTYGYYNLVRN